MNGLNVRGLDEVISNLGKFDQLFESRRRTVLMYAAVPLVAEMAKRAPVGSKPHVRYYKSGKKKAGKGQGRIAKRYRPGNLRGSVMILRHLRRNEAVNVGPKVGKSRFDGYYAHMVEFGTIHSNRRPFVQPAIDVAAPQVRRRIELEYARIVRNYTTQ